jgi:putative ABC transport system ATP-binding protein
MVAIMGPSGSGKSTLLNLLGCLDRPTSGAYWLDGARLGDFDQDRIAALRNSSIGFVFQSFHLLPRLTARQNVELPLGYAGWRARERRVRALDLLGQLGMADRADHLPRQLSGGQQQRVAIARALANSPALILADEPTGSLESRAGASIMDLFRSLNRSGVTLVIVTHDEAVARHARRIIQLLDGRLISDRSNAPVHSAVGPEQI